MRGAKALAAVLLIAVFAASNVRAGPPSGIRGMVIRSPTTPVCRAGQPCSAPAAGVALIVTRNGATVARRPQGTEASGSCSRPGGTSFGWPGRRGSEACRPGPLRVWQGQFTTVRLVARYRHPLSFSTTMALRTRRGACKTPRAPLEAASGSCHSEGRPHESSSCPARVLGQPAVAVCAIVAASSAFAATRQIPSSGTTQLRSRAAGSRRDPVPGVAAVRHKRGRGRR